MKLVAYIYIFFSATFSSISKRLNGIDDNEKHVKRVKNVSYESQSESAIFNPDNKNSIDKIQSSKSHSTMDSEIILKSTLMNNNDRLQSKSNSDHKYANSHFLFLRLFLNKVPL